MQFKQLHENFKLPTKGSEQAGAIDLYMPEAGSADCGPIPTKVGLGFAAAVPPGYVGLILPRSGVGGKHGLELNNTCGVIDSDYRGEWIAKLRVKGEGRFSWEKGDRVLQVIIVPALSVEPELVDYLDSTERGAGGFGSSGQ